jgi:hypothetical protein
MATDTDTLHKTLVQTTNLSILQEDENTKRLPKNTPKPKALHSLVKRNDELKAALAIVLSSLASHFQTSACRFDHKLEMSGCQTHCCTHWMVIVPASLSALILISRSGVSPKRLWSVTLRKRSLSRASLALLHKPVCVLLLPSHTIITKSANQQHMCSAEGICQ